MLGSGMRVGCAWGCGEFGGRGIGNKCTWTTIKKNKKKNKIVWVKDTIMYEEITEICTNEKADNYNK